VDGAPRVRQWLTVTNRCWGRKLRRRSGGEHMPIVCRAWGRLQRREGCLTKLVEVMKKKAAEPEARRPGRPALPEGCSRTGRISMRTYPDIEEKVKRNGTSWLESLIRRAKDGTGAG